MRRRSRSRFAGRAASRSLPRPVLWGIGLAGIGAVVLMFLVGYNAPNSIPGRQYLTVKAAFDNADNLTAHYQVRIAGRNVGQVLDPRVENGKAVVDLQLNPEVEPLLSDSTLRVRPRSPIGVRFVELSPGSKGRPLRDGDVIATDQTSASTELDTTLSTFDARRRKKAQELANGLGTGVLGRGTDIQTLLDDGPDGLRGLQRIAKPINDRTDAVRGFVRGADGASTAADPVRDTIRRGFGDGSDALAAIAASGDDLASSLDEAPSSLSTARAGLADAEPLLREIRALSRVSLPALQPAPAGLRSTSRLIQDSPAGLKSARTTLGKLDDAVDPTLGLLAKVDPVLPAFRKGLASSLPVVDRLGAHGCDFALFAKNWSSMMGQGVPGGDPDIGTINSLRLNVLSSEESITGARVRSPLVVDNPYPAPCTVTQDARTHR
ncbi:MlaD family protein [Patulibacter minatonensis]|uniref:MlaD family protein n=1 Tax=Patulibacter minatonensis TaxID=298163 RepID=UPI000A017127|nr:MlaD family protein [Patulibacter minatonensis]